jgi:hypothetical protein
MLTQDHGQALVQVPSVNTTTSVTLMVALKAEVRWEQNQGHPDNTV